MSTSIQETELAHRVAAALTGIQPGVPVGELRTLPGGHSGLTYSVTAGDGRYVVKAVPPGQRAVGRNDVLRQARVLAALAGSPVPVPGVAAVDETQPAWFAMDFAAGEASSPYSTSPRCPPATARARMLEIAHVLRRLHETDVDAPGLDAPPPLGAAGELERWSRTLHAVPAELRPGGEELLAAPRRGRARRSAAVLLHGDFRLGNVLCVERARGRRRGLGDLERRRPRIDLGWFLLFADHRNFPGLGDAVPGCPPRPNCSPPTSTAHRRCPPWTGSGPWAA